MKISKFFLNSIASLDLWSYEHRLKLYRIFGLKGDNIYIESGCQFESVDLSKLILGNDVFINRSCYIDNSSYVVIGDNSCLAPKITLITTSHSNGTADKRTGKDFKIASIRIGKGWWICTV